MLKNSKDIKIEKACRACGGAKLRNVLSFGPMPLANALLRAKDLKRKEAFYPLSLAFCPACSLVQIRETVSPEKLFSHYLYFSSFSDTMLEHAKTLSKSAASQKRLGPKSLVVEIASNDGYLLKNFVKRGIPVMGIEPAANIARAAKKNGVPTVCDFFGERLAGDLASQGKRADVVLALNVMAHVGDLAGFVKGIRLLLKDDGIGIVEVPYVRDLIDHAEFDTIYHEHLCYFSLLAMRRLFEKHGLCVIDAKRVAIHGGSLRVTVSKRFRKSKSADSICRQERALGLDRMSFYKKFAVRVKRLGADLTKTLTAFKRSGKKLAAYGAGAKGVVLLNYYGIGKKTLDFVVDRSPYKQGRYLPGVHLPVCAPSDLLRRKPDYVLLLTWNFAGEILKQQRLFHKNGGRFVIPLPKVRLV